MVQALKSQPAFKSVPKKIEGEEFRDKMGELVQVVHDWANGYEVALKQVKAGQTGAAIIRTKKLVSNLSKALFLCRYGEKTKTLHNYRTLYVMNKHTKAIKSRLKELFKLLKSQKEIAEKAVKATTDAKASKTFGHILSEIPANSVEHLAITANEIMHLVSVIPLINGHEYDFLTGTGKFADTNEKLRRKLWNRWIRKHGNIIIHGKKDQAFNNLDLSRYDLTQCFFSNCSFPGVKFPKKIHRGSFVGCTFSALKGDVQLKDFGLQDCFFLQIKEKALYFDVHTFTNCKFGSLVDCDVRIHCNQDSSSPAVEDIHFVSCGVDIRIAVISMIALIMENCDGRLVVEGGFIKGAKISGCKGTMSLRNAKLASTYITSSSFILDSDDSILEEFNFQGGQVKTPGRSRGEAFTSLKKVVFRGELDMKIRVKYLKDVTFQGTKNKADLVALYDKPKIRSLKILGCNFIMDPASQMERTLFSDCPTLKFAPNTIFVSCSFVNCQSISGLYSLKSSVYWEFKNCHFINSGFKGVNLQGSDFNGSTVHDIKFSQCMDVDDVKNPPHGWDDEIFRNSKN